MIIGEQNTDLKRLTGRLKLRFLTEIGRYRPGLTKPGEVGDFFALVSMKSPNFCQKAKF
jgi:hypothetical protein